MININECLKKAKELGFANIQSVLIFCEIANSANYSASVEEIAEKLTILDLKPNSVGKYVKKMIQNDVLKYEIIDREKKITLTVKGKEYMNELEKNPDGFERINLENNPFNRKDSILEKNPKDDEDAELKRIKKHHMDILYMYAIGAKKEPKIFKRSINMHIDAVCQIGQQDLFFDLLSEIFHDSSNYKF